MTAKVTVWWIGAEAIGVGHGSFSIGNTYVTWLAAYGAGSSQSKIVGKRIGPS